MNAPKYGGIWTEVKLQVLQSYLSAYLNVLKPHNYKLLYIDTFAGPGYWEKHASKLGEQLFDVEHNRYEDGSPIIALDAMSTGNLKCPFDQFYFIDNNKKYIGNLEAVVREERPEQLGKIKFIKGDANIEMEALCCNVDWESSRAVVFLDPFGMEVNWNTIKTIAKTEAMDMWVLFPLGIGVNRMLTKNGNIPQEWGNSLTALFGTDEWYRHFYRTTAVRQYDLLATGEKYELQKNANFRAIADYYVQRLKTVFAGVVEEPLMLKNSKGNPILSLFFAAGNPRGAKIAIKIAKDIINKNNER